jgi:hypothetical protein
MNNPYSHDMPQYNWTGQRIDDVYNQGQNLVEEPTVHETSNWRESHQIPLQANTSGQEWGSVTMLRVGYNHSSIQQHILCQGRETTVPKSSRISINARRSPPRQGTDAKEATRGNPTCEALKNSPERTDNV